MGNGKAGKVSVQGHKNTKNRELGRAVNCTVEAMEQRVMLAVTPHVPLWVEQGPGTVTGASTGSRIPAAGGVAANPAVGAIQGVATLATSADIVFVATVNGGIWRTLDATSGNPTWTALAQDKPSLSYGAIAISPFDNTGVAVAGQPVATLAQRTALANKLVVYAGNASFSSTFDRSFPPSPGAPRLGVWSSTNGGTTFELSKNSLKSFDGLDIYRIAPSLTNPNLLLVAAGSSSANPQADGAGIWVSTNRGTTYQHVLGGDPPKHFVTAGDATDVIADPSNGNRFYAAITDVNTGSVTDVKGGAAIAAGVYTSTNAGSTWTLVNGSGTNNLSAAATDAINDDRDTVAGADANEGVSGAGIIKLAIHNSGTNNVVYAGLVSDQTRRAMAIYRSTDKAANWIKLPSFGAGTNAAGVPDINPLQQGRKNFSMLADPASPNVLFITGDNDPTTQLEGVGFRFDLASGTPWSQITLAGAPGTNATNTAPHSDSRNLVFDANGGLIDVDDGGIYRLNNPNGTSRAWTSLNGSGTSGLHIAEFWSVARDPVKQTMFGGIQDIGVIEQPTNGATFNWAFQPSGDGGVAQVGGVNSAVHYSSGETFKHFEERTYSGTALTTVIPTLSVIGSNGTNAAGLKKLTPSYDSTLPFTTHFAIDTIQSTNQANTRILIGSSNLYESFDDGKTLIPLGGLGPGPAFTPNVSLGIGGVTAIVYGGRASNGAAMPDVAYIGADGRDFRVRQTIAIPGSPVLGDFQKRPAYPGRDINGIVIKPNDFTQGFVVDQRGGVFSFKNTGSTAADWKRITGNLPTTLVRAIELVPSNNPAVKGGFMVLVGGLNGVFVCLDPTAASPKWAQVGTGLPNAIVNDLRYDSVNKVLYCGTLGRGAWSIANFPASINAAALPGAPVGAPAGAPLINATDPGSLEIVGDALADKNDTIRLVLDANNPNLLNVFLDNTTGIADLTIPATAIQRVFVTGGQGDDTLLIDDANGIVAFDQGIVFDQAGPGTNVQQEINQTPIDGGIASKIRSGLATLADWSAKLAKFGELAEQIPGLGVNIAQTLGIGDGSDPISGVLKKGLLDPISNFFSTDVTPTVQELTGLIRTLSAPLGNVSFGIDPASVQGGVFDVGGHQELRIDVNLDLAGFADNLSLDFGTAVKSLGLTLDANGKVNLETSLNFSFSFGVDLTPGLSDDDAFFITVNNLSASAHVAGGDVEKPDDSVPDDNGEGEKESGDTPTGPGLNFGLNVGFLSAKIVDGGFELGAFAKVVFNNPDNDAAGHITVSELKGTSLDSLIDLHMDGDFEARLPVQVSLAGLTAVSPVITITSEDFFDSAPTVDVENMDNLLNFDNLSPLAILGMLKQVGSFLETFKGSAALSTKIPFTSKTVGDILDIGNAFTDKLYKFLEPQPGKPAFDSAQGLADLLATTLGISPATVGANYDAATNTLLYHVKIADAFAPQSLPVDLGLSLGSLAGLSTSSTLSVTANAGIEFTFGIVLASPSATITGGIDAPSNGRLSSAAHFSVIVGGNDAVDVTVAADATNNTVDDLVADINTALSAAGLSDTVKAGKSGNKITFSTLGLLTPAALTINCTAGDSAETQLGLQDSQSASNSIANNFFIKDASVTGSASLNATDINANAHLGFLGVGVVHGTGGVTASFNAQLIDPGTDAADGKITFGEIFNALANNVSSLVPSPTLSGSANLTLPLSVTPNIFGAGAPVAPAATVTWTDIKDPNTLSVNFNADTSKLLDFQNVSFAGVLQAILQGVQYIASLEKFSFLSTKLPLLNKSVSDLIGAADQLLQKVNAAANASPADSLQTLATTLNSALGLPAGAITLTIDGRAIKVGLAFHAGGTQQIPINFDLASLAAGVPGLSQVTNLVDVTGSGNLTVGANADINLNIGVDVTNPTSPRPFLYDDSNLHFDAKATGTGLNFTASVGPLGLFIKNGTVNLDGDGNPATNDSAQFNVTIKNDNGDGRHYFDELDTGDVNMTLTGQVHASLPLFFPTQTSPLNPPLAIAITDLSHISTTTNVTTPNLDIQFNAADLLSNVGAMLDGLDLLLGKLGDGVASQVLNHKLPLVGGNLKDAITFINDIRVNGIEPLKAQLGDKPAADALKNGLFSALGPSGLGVLGDLDGNGTIDLNDVGVALGNGGSQILFTTRLHIAPKTLDVPLGFDVGLPGLGLSVDGDVQAKVGFDFKLSFGLNKTDGFFFVTDTRDASNNPIPEMNLSVDATTPGLSATGTLAVLQVKATDSTTTPTHLNANFSVDLKDPNNDGKLTMAEMAAGPALSDIVKAKLTANANVNLHLVGGFGAGANFPSISTDFALNWSFTNAPTDSPDASFGNKPTVNFTNVQLNAGEFFSNFAKPILDNVQKVLKPIQPIIDILNTRLPVLSDIKVARNLLDFDHSGDVTILDLVHFFNPNSKLEFITSLAKTVDLINSIPTNLNSLMLNLGKFDIGSDLRSVTTLKDTDLTNIVQNAIDPQLTGSAATFNSKMADLNAVPGAGLAFPILKSPSSVFKLLIGQDINLFTYDMPTLSATFDISEFFPILGPLGARFTGSLGATAHFGFGYDTSGLREYIKASSTDRTLSMLLDGLYVSDRKNADGTGDDVPEATLTGGITAAAELNLGIASAGVSGGIFAHINFNLHDPNNDGKVRFNELLQQFQKGPLSIFDVSGDLTAGLSAYISFLFSKKTFNLATVKLLDFNVDSAAAHPDPILATMLPGGVLQLNVGANAAARQFGDLSDGDDVISVSPGATAGTITVEAFGFTQDFTGVSKIVADGGAGNDTITVKSGLNIPASLSGGIGNDSLFGGDGGATLNGGAGDDQLSGGNGNDSIVGGDGNDIMLGNGGNDNINGGIGDDTAEGGDGSDVLVGDVGDDVLSGGLGDDNLDGGDGNDALNGDEGSDVMTGDAGNDQLDGDDGNDSMLGGDGNDTFTAGGGNDTAFGGAGNDNIDGASGNDQLFGEAGTDSITGGTGNDSITGDDGDDIIDAGAGNDSITGGIGNDNINAGDGNDFVDAGDGNDSVLGGIGSDSIIGGLGVDNINAGSDSVAGSTSDTSLIYGDNPTGASGSADVIVGDVGNDEIHGGAGNDSISGLGGDDVIFGDDGDDSISGGAGNDIITGGTGNDALSGQEGDDAISGDDGIDYVSGDAGSDLLWGGAASFTRVAFLAGGFAADGVTPLILNGATLDGVVSDGKDSVLGGAGADWLFGGGDVDQLYGGSENDYLDAGAGNDTADGGAGNDVVRGGSNADIVRGGSGIDQVYGDDGDDSLFGDAGDASGNQAGQKLFGGAGNDQLFAYAATTSSAEFALVGDELHGGDGNDSLNGNIRKDKLFGDDGNDLLLGDSLNGPFYALNAQPATFGAADQMFGGTGQDQIFGGGGNDTAFGGADSDRLEGQDGADQLYGGTGIDVIVLDVDASYTTTGDSFDGQFGNDAQNDVLDDGATDILLINGTNFDDTILIGETAAPASVLQVTYNGRLIPATWVGAGGPLIEQIRVSGLGGNDRIEFLSGVGGIDVSALSARSSDFIGVIDGGTGNDSLVGTNGRDRLDGGRGSDIVKGMGGDDRLFGDGGAGQGDLTDFDQLFAGQGDDDLIGGQGHNSLFAWSRDPSLGAQFGVFVDPSGGLHDDDGDLNNDGHLDSDPSKAPYVLEDTGMNRMLGSTQGGDKLFGGTNLDFMYGNGGQDQLYNRDGTPFENLDDNGVAGQQWKDYARASGKVWYVGGSNLDDIITVDFVTEPGALAGHHLVTRLTNNNGNFSFAAKVQLDFEAHNPDGSLVWDPSKLVLDPNTMQPQDTTYANLLPPEGDFQAILIDALDGNDTVTVGPTVTKSVWIDGGAGNDHITIKSGNPILPDQLEGTGRNDTQAKAYNFTTDARIGAITANKVLTGMTLDSPTDFDFYRFRLASPINGNLKVSSLSASDGMVLQILNAAGAVQATALNGVVSLAGLAAGTDFFLKISSNLNPTIYQLEFAATPTPVTINVSNQTLIVRRDIILGGSGNDVLSGGSGEDWVLGGDGNDVLAGGLDHQASDLLFGEAGDDTFQLIPDALPTIPGSDRTIVPTLTDAFDGGTGNDRVLFLGGDKDSNNKVVPDTVAILYNVVLHRYEFTSLIWDSANQRYETVTPGGTDYKQVFSFYQTQNVEHTVIDTRAGDDEIHADPGYTLGGVTYGIAPGAFQQNAQIAALQILGGDGNDRIFGGAMGDIIDGGAGSDYISGGGGNDSITGGGDNDVVVGNVSVPPDRYETVVRNGVSGHNDNPAFAAMLPTITPGQTIDNLTLNIGDTGDWYILKTPDALMRLGTSQAAFLTAAMIDVRGSDGTAGKFFLFAGQQTDPNDPLSILPIEKPTGVPGYYMIHVLRTVNPANGTIPPEVAGTYHITFSPQLGQTVQVPPSQANYSINSANPADQPAVIPLGDINGDGFVDFVAAIQDYTGSAADDLNPNNPSGFVNYPYNSADYLAPSFARIYFGTGSATNFTLPTNAVTLKLPAPLSAPSYFGSQSFIANPADYNGDGIKDIAVLVTHGSRRTPTESPFLTEGVYIIFGKAAGFSGTIDVVANADVTIKGFAQPAQTLSTDTYMSIAGGDVNGDGLDDLLVGDPAAGANAQGAAYLFLGRTNWASVSNTQRFSADFNDAGGLPSADGFTTDNTGAANAGLWHTSTGRNTQANHTQGGSMYFGTGEDPTLGGGNYNGGARSGRITSPAIDLTGLASAKLSFKYLLGTEPLPPSLDVSGIFDDATIMISQNNGPFQPLQVRDGATARSGGASNHVLGDNGFGMTFVEPGTLADPSNGWLSANFDLSAYVGSSIKIQFSFTSNTQNNAFEGWYVDDVAVTGAVLSPANANATFSGTTAGERVGSSIAAIGDFNKDNKKDFAVMRPADDTLKGQAYILFGKGPGDAAFTSSSIATLASGAGGAIIQSAGSFDGFSVNGAGDVNGDGFADILLTPHSGTRFLGRSNPPTSFLVFGRSNLSGVNQLTTMSNVKSTQGTVGLIALGDVNGDGFADLGANAVISTAGISEDNRVVNHSVGEVFLGRANAQTTLSLTTPDLVIEPGKPNYANLDFRYFLFGSPGDLNKDGKSDFVLADNLGGSSRVYLGQALQTAQTSAGNGGNSQTPTDFQFPLADPNSTTPSTAPTGVNLALPPVSPDLKNAFDLQGSVAHEQLSAPRSAGDLNGDHIDDFIVEGTLHSYVIFGPADINDKLDVASRANIVLNRSDNLSLAQRMIDVDGDGVNDLIFISNVNPTAPSDSGLRNVSVGIIFGGAGLPHNPTLANADRIITFQNGFHFTFNFSSGLVPAIDFQFAVDGLNFDGDANGDIVMIAHDGGDAVGYVISGKQLMADSDHSFTIGSPVFGEGVPALTLKPDATDRKAAQLAFFGPRFGGYDGFVFAPQFSIAVPGDINGDGKEDFVLTDSRYAQDHIAATLGRAYVFLGRPLPTPTVTVPTITLDTADRTYQAAYFGANAIAVGDMNGDGYADFAVSRSQEGGNFASSNLLFFYGKPNIAAPFSSTSADAFADQHVTLKTGDPNISKIEAAIQGSVIVSGNLYATTGDFNGDGKLDLAIGDPTRTLLDLQGNILDVQNQGQVFIFFSIASHASGIALPTADRILSGEGQFDQFGTLSINGPIDLNRDHHGDLVIGAGSADVTAPALLAGGGKVYVIYDGTAPQTLPTTGVGTLSNQTFTGDGDFLSDLNTGPISFKDIDPNAPPRYTLSAGQSELWYNFTTLGDGQSNSTIRLTPPAKGSTTVTLRGPDASLLPTQPAIGVQSGGASFSLGGVAGRIGVFELDLSSLLPYIEQTNLLHQVFLQLDYSNAVLVAGQKLSVFIGKSKSDGFVTPADVTAAATLAGERTFTAADGTSGVISIDITSAIRAALAAGKTRIMLRLTTSSPSVSLDIQHSTTSGRQTGLAVTTEPQQGVVGDLYDAAGNLLAKGLSVISLRPFNAGKFFLRVYDPFGAAPSAIPFTIEMTVPAAGALHSDPDRDQVSGGDGDDSVSGNDGLDRLYGQSGNDFFIGDKAEVIDQQTGEVIQGPAGGQSSNAVYAEADPVVIIPDAGLRAAIADALGIGHTPGTALHLTQPFLASQLAQITSFDASNRQIADLTGLEQLINLESLNLSHNSISQLLSTDPHFGLLNLTRLKSLDLSFNKLSDSGLAGIASLTGLHSLILDNNPLRTVTSLAGLSSNPNLTFLSLDGAASSPAVLPTSVRGSDLLAKFNNPTPVGGDQAGKAVAAVGGNIAIADPFDDTAGTDAGAVYLYDAATGQLIRTLTGASNNEQFGFAVTSVGNLLLVGAPGALVNTLNGLVPEGIVYVYDGATGNLLRTVSGITLSGGDGFGSSLAPMGNEVLIGEPGHSFLFGPSSQGAVARYNPFTGSFISLYSNPSGLGGDRLGTSVAFTNGHVFAGAAGVNSNAGAVYMVDPVSGVFTTISSGLGTVMAPVGGNLAVGAPNANGGSGAVFIYDGNTGALLRSINSPGGAGTAEQFGAALAGYDNSILAVGAPGASPSGLSHAGQVYLIDSNTSAVIQTYTSIAPNTIIATNAFFGSSIAIDNGDLLVGAPGEFIGLSPVGTASLVKGPRVSDLTPLQGLTHLKTLSLNNQRIANPLALGGLTTLQNLYLQANQITGNLNPLTGLPNLVSLTLNQNPLDNASFTTTIPTLTSKLATFTFDADQAPIIQPVTTIATTAGSQVNVSLVSSDPDAGDPVYTSVASDNPNVTVSIVIGNTLIITVAPTFLSGLAHITITATDGPSGALDWRGRVTTRTIDVSVGLGAITGAKFNDFNNNGTRDPGDTGVAGWQVFLDLNNNGLYDAATDTLTATDADGNYVFSGLAPGNYTVGEIGLSAWFPTTPRQVLSANFTAGAQGFTNSGASDPWHVTTRRGTDAGHTGTQSFYFGSEATGTYANSSTGTLTSPMIDLRNTTGPVRLDFNSFLIAATGSSPLASADFATTTAGTTASNDGYAVTGLWHTSSSRGGAFTGHTSNFSMYFGSEATHQYTANSTGTLTSPVIDLTGITGKINLDLNYFLSANSNTFPATFDAATITVIGTGGVRTVIAANAASGKAKLVNTTGTVFTPLSLSLSSFAGQQIRLEFKFQADSDARIAEGWYVDDVNISIASADVATVGVFKSDGTFTPLVDSSAIGGIPNNNGVWNPMSLDLTPFDGQQFQIQYKFSSDASLNAEGWYIDDPAVTIGIRTQLTLAAGQVATGIDFGGLMVANTGPDQSVTPGQPISITPIITDPNPNDGSNFGYAWSVTASNGQVISPATTTNFAFTPSSAGTYTVSLNLTDHNDGDRTYTDSAIYTVTGDPAGLATSNGGTYTITGTQAAPILNVLTGTVMISPQLYATFPNLSANVANGAVLSLNGSQHLAGLTLANGAVANVMTGGTLTADALSLTGSAKLDLGTGFFILNYQAGQSAAALAQVSALIKSGYNNGTWNGPGITSSNAAATSGRAIGFENNNNGAGGAVLPTFGGQTAGANSILARFTLAADADLDGNVGFNDLVAVAQHYDKPANSWSLGDFNFDGISDFSDLVKIAQAYDQNLPAAAPEEVAPALTSAPATTTTPPPSTPTATLTVGTPVWTPVDPAIAPPVKNGSFVPTAKPILPPISAQTVSRPRLAATIKPTTTPRATFSSKSIASKQSASSPAVKKSVAQNQPAISPASPFSVTRAKVKNELLT